MTRKLQRVGKHLRGVLAAFVLLGPFSAGAVTLSLSPATLSPSVGSPFTLDLVVSGSAAGAAPSLGGFDIGIAFDPSAVSFTGVTYGTLLGAVPAQATVGTLTAPGAVSLAEVSFLAPATLDGLQPDSFILATLSFVATTETPSVVGISSALLSDGFGRPLGVETPFGSAALTPTPSSVVPEPGAALLYALGLLVVSRSRALARRAQ